MFQNCLFRVVLIALLSVKKYSWLFCCLIKIYSTGLISTFGLISTWLIVVTAAMRYIVICHPFSAPRGDYTSHVRSYIAITLTYVICTLCNVPSFFLFNARTMVVHNETKLLIDLGPFSHDTTAGLVFHWMKEVMTIFVPGPLLCFFNIRLLQASVKTVNNKLIDKY